MLLVILNPFLPLVARILITYYYKNGWNTIDKDCKHSEENDNDEDNSKELNKSVHYPTTTAPFYIYYSIYK